MSEHKNPLWKQLLGAGAGMAIALSLYGVYTVAAPPVTAFVSSVLASDAPQGLTFTEGDRSQRRAEIVARARDIIEKELGDAGR